MLLDLGASWGKRLGKRIPMVTISVTAWRLGSPAAGSYLIASTWPRNTADASLNAFATSGRGGPSQVAEAGCEQVAAMANARTQRLRKRSNGVADISV